MILTLMFHRINDKKLFEKGLTAIMNNHPIVLPGDIVNLLRLNICFSFDDAYSDFFEFVFPLLKSFGIKALLAVPVKFVGKEGYSSWKELEEMASSGLVHIASHSYSHANLLDLETNLKLEIEESKKILEKTLNISIDTFVYPYGKFNRKIHRLVKNHYKFVMRIGSAINFSWQNLSGVIYRVEGEGQMKKLKSPLSYIWPFLINSIQRR